MKKLLKVALKEQGVTEIVGEKHTPRILEYFAYTGHKWVKDDETAWCSAFANFCAKMAGLAYSGKLDARSWLKVGEAVEVGRQLPGDIVVFWRGSPDGWKGHVAIYQYEDNDYYYVLGGNQGNMVKVSGYAKKRLLGFRMLE